MKTLGYSCISRGICSTLELYKWQTIEIYPTHLTKYYYRLVVVICWITPSWRELYTWHPCTHLWKHSTSFELEIILFYWGCYLLEIKLHARRTNDTKVLSFHENKDGWMRQVALEPPRTLYPIIFLWVLD